MMHPIVKALIETIPLEKTPWPASARAAWLKMMGDALNMAFPLADGEEPKPKRGRPANKTKAAKVDPPFYIDKHGYARRAGGDRVIAKEVAGYVVDQRGENGDLGAIVWGDDTRGIPKGMQLDITISE